MFDLKPPKTFAELNDLFDERGIVRDVPGRLELFLQQNNYYRFNAYFHQFLNSDDQFVKGTHLSTLLDIYENDRWLRKLLLLPLEPIEIKLRCQLAYWMAHKFGSSVIYCQGAFANDDNRIIVLNTFNEMINKSDATYDPVKKHHCIKYSGQFPIWVIIEYLSFGEISKMFKNVQRNIQDLVSTSFNSQPTHLVSQWIHALSTLRNACAHYGHLFKREFPVTPIIPNNSIMSQKKTKRLFSYIYTLKLLSSENNWIDFKKILFHRLDLAQNFFYDDYGFPDDWKTIIE